MTNITGFGFDSEDAFLDIREMLFDWNHFYDYNMELAIERGFEETLNALDADIKGMSEDEAIEAGYEEADYAMFAVKRFLDYVEEVRSNNKGLHFEHPDYIQYPDTDDEYLIQILKYTLEILQKRLDAAYEEDEKKYEKEGA